MTDQSIPNSTRDQVALMSFIENLIKEKNDQSIKPDQMNNVKTVLLKEVNEMINTRLISLLSEESQKELDGLLDKNISDEELDQFFIKKIPNLSSEVASVLIDFRTAYLSPLDQVAEKEVKAKEELKVPLPAPISN